MAFADRVPDRFAAAVPVDGRALRERYIRMGLIRPNAPPVFVQSSSPTLRIGPIVLRNEPEPDASTCSD